MADTITTNYGFTKPEVGASDDTWGTKLNTNWDDVDAQVKVNEDDLAAHEARTDNPHSTTKTLVGLGNVPNEDATDPVNWDQAGAVTGDRIEWDGSKWAPSSPGLGDGLQALPVNVIGATSSNQTLDLSANTVFELEPTANITISTTGLITSARAVAFLHITNGGLQTLTFGNEITWAGDAGVPAFSTPTGATPDIGSASFDRLLDIDSQTSSNIESITRNSDDTKFYIVNDGADTILQYGFSIPGDLNSGSFEKSFDVSAQVTSVNAITFNSAGTKMYVLGFDTVHQYGLSTSDDIGSASFEKQFDAGAASSRIGMESIALSGNEGTMFTTASSTNPEKSEVLQFALSTTGEVDTMSFEKSFDITSQLSDDAVGIFVSPAGEKFFAVSFRNIIAQYGMSSANDIGTASFEKSLDLDSESEVDAIAGITFSSDFTNMYLLNESSFGDEILQYTGTQAGIRDAIDIVAFHQHSTGDIAAEITHKGVAF